MKDGVPYTEYQHIVPKFHLRHFSSDGIVQVRDIWSGDLYPCNISNIGGYDFIYDYDTSVYGSMENILQEDEKRFGGPIDSYLKGQRRLSSDFLIEYLCKLISRSYSMIESAFDYSMKMFNQSCLYSHYELL